jgi:hypothetical protein
LKNAFEVCKCQEKSEIDNLSGGRTQNIPKKENYRVEPAKCGIQVLKLFGHTAGVWTNFTR